MSYFVIENPNPQQRRGLLDARYLSYAHGRDDVPRYTLFTDRLRRAKKWRTRSGAERYLGRHPNLIGAGFVVVELGEGATDA